VTPLKVPAAKKAAAAVLTAAAAFLAVIVYNRKNAFTRLGRKYCR